MDKKLPGVFANKVTSNGNNDKIFYGHHENIIVNDNDSESLPKKNIDQKINEIFNSTNYIYKADVVITLKNGNVTKRIVGRNNKYLITMDNELILIKDILDIKKK